MINLFYPNINIKKAQKNINKVLASRWIGQGELVDEFEKRMADYLKTNYVVAVSSGTAALHLAYILADIRDGDEVITTPLTCTLTNIPLLYQKAKIIFADIQPNTLNIDPEDVEKKILPKTQAIVCVHLGGYSCDMSELATIARKYKLKLIEDSGQGIGGYYNNLPLGTIGDYGCISLQAIKNLTTGDGGLLICKNRQDYEKAKRLRWAGIDRERKKKLNWQPWLNRAITFDINEIGFKYQMTNISAAIGLANLEKLEKWLKQRIEFVRIYREGLRDVPQIKLLSQEKDRISANWLFGILAQNRDGLCHYLESNGIETNVVQIRNDIYSLFGGKRQKLPNLNSIEYQYIYLPLNNKLKVKDIKKVIKKIKRYYANFSNFN